MSEESKPWNSSDDELPSCSLDKSIRIPTVQVSDSEGEGNISFRRKISSSEASEDEDRQGFYGDSPKTRPVHLLKSARKQAREFCEKGEFERAVKERVRCLTYCRLVYGDGHWQIAGAHAKLGETYLKRRGFSRQAMVHATRARDELLQGQSEEFRSNRVAHSKEVLGVLQLTYFVMGKASFLVGEHGKAEQAFKKAEISAEKRLRFEDGNMSEMYVRILECLGQVSVRLKKFNDGIMYYEKALGQARKIFGKSGKELISLYQGLSQTYRKAGYGEKKCMEFLENCFTLAEKNFSEGTTDLADVLYSTSLDMQVIGGYGYTKSLEVLERCLKIYMDAYGSDHKKTIQVQETLCSTLVQHGEHDKAAGVLHNIISSKVMMYGDPSTSLAESYQLLGTIRLTQGKVEKAVKYFSKCESMLSCILGSNHKKTVQITETLNMIKKTPGGMKFQSTSKKLEDRPRFNGTVGRSTLLGLNAVPNS